MLLASLGLLHLRTSYTQTTVPSAHLEISKHSLPSVFLSTFQGGEGDIKSPKMGKLRHEEMGLCMRENAMSQPLSQAYDAQQKWEGFEIMAGVADKEIVMSSA